MYLFMIFPILVYSFINFVEVKILIRQ